MNKNLALALGLLLVLAFAGWQLLGRSEEAQVPIGVSLEAEAEAEAVAEQVSPGGDLTLGTEAGPSGARHVESVAPRIAAETGDLVVRVVDTFDEPLAGVEVLVLHHADSEVVDAFDDLARVDELMEREAAVAFSDAAGLLHLATTSEGTSLLLLGRTDETWGSERFSFFDLRRSKVKPLVLRRDRTVRARVVDGTGRPLGGYPVTLNEVNGAWIGTLTPDVFTSADGVATFQHAQSSLLDAYAREGDRYVIQLGVLAPRFIRAPLDLDSYDGSLIELEAPATGSVELRVFTFEGEPYPGRSETRLSHVPEGAPRVLPPFSNEVRTTLEVRAQEGVARYPFVALGMELDAAVSRPHRTVSAHAYGPGPTRAGETVTIDVRFGAEHPIVQLRLLGADQQPLETHEVQYRVSSSPLFTGLSRTIRIETGTDGLVRLDLTPRPGDASARFLSIQGRTAAGQVQVATIELPRKLERGLHDLGELRLETMPLLASGLVVSSSGVPARNAGLELEHRPESGRRWSAPPGIDLRVMDDGRFEVRGRVADGRLRVAAVREGSSATWVEFSPGARDVVVELRPEASIRGRIRTDDGIDPQCLRLLVTDGPVDERLDFRQQRPIPDTDGGFDLRGLREESMRTVTLELDEAAFELRRFEDVAAVPDTEAQDPRLNPIDLRGVVFAHQIEVVGLDEDELLEGKVVYGPTGAGELPLEVYCEGHSFSLLSTSPRVDLRATFIGFRPVVLESVGKSAVIELQPAIQVTLVLVGDFELPEPPYFLSPILAPLEDDEADPRTVGDAFDDRRRARVLAPVPGRLRLWWFTAARRDEIYSSGSTVELEREQCVDVKDGVDDQVFEVELTAEEMSRIMESFQ